MIEYSSSKRGDGMAALTRSLAQAHPSIVRGVNQRRRQLGLLEVPTRGNPLAPPPRPARMARGTTGGRGCKAAGRAALMLDAAIMIGRLKMNARQ